MNNLALNYYEVMKNKELFDKPGNHILISDANSSISVTELNSLFKIIKYADISLHINLFSGFSKEFIDFCLSHRFLVYFDIMNDINISFLNQLSMLDIVALINIDIFDNLSDYVIDIIVQYNINVVLLQKTGDYQKIIFIYEKLLSKGFSKIFNIGYTVLKEDYKAEPIGLITRRQIEDFNINQNLMIKSQIEDLKRNVMKRHNRMLAAKKNDSKTDIMLINVNVNIAITIERKNLGIEYLVSVLKLNGYNADCLYCNQLTVVSKIKQIIEENMVKVIGFSCMQDNIHVVKNIIKYIKLHYPDVFCFVGGAQAVALGEKFLRESGVNYIMVGESENNIAKLMDYIVHSNGSIENVPSIRYLDVNGEYRETREGELIKNLDNIPFPNYVFKSDDNLTLPGIITGRGCPYNCAFCFEGAKEKTVRYRSLNNVFEEISILLKNNKNVRLIQIYDDTFTLDEKRVIEFCNRFRKIREIYSVSWICEIHCQTVYDKPELIRYMVESGLLEAQIGIESGNEAVLKRYNKTITPEMIKKTVEYCNLAGLNMLEGNILLGGAGETKEEIESNFEFVEELLHVGKGMLQIYPVMFWPFFKTPIMSNPSKYGVKIIPDQCEYTIHCIGNFVSESETVTRQEFVDYYDKLKKKIDDVYKKIASRFTEKEARKHWLNGSFNMISTWGRHLSKYRYMQIYFTAKDKGSVDVLYDGAYPIRTFNVLSYKNNQLYLEESDILLDELDSRILELCNGNNTVDEISLRLLYSVHEIRERLVSLEDKMLIYGSVL